MSGRFWLVVALAGAGALCAPAPATAHALLETSRPADGQTLERAPAEATLTFTESPDPALSALTLLDASGRTVARPLPVLVAGDPRSLRALLPPLARRGAYTLAWRVVSRVDGHLTAGAVAFGVGVQAEAAQAEPGAQARGPRPLGVASRVALLAGLLLLAGLGGAVTWLPAGGPAGSAIPVALGSGRHAVRWAAPAAGLAALLGLFGLAWSEARAAGVGLTAFAGSGRGDVLAREAVAIGACAVAALAWALRPRRRVLWVLAVLAAAALWAHASAGHAAASGAAGRAVLVQWAHLVAVGLWVGGFAWLLPWLRADPSAGARFSRAAGVALLVAVGSGVARSLAELGSVRDLLATGFGRSLTVKVAVVAGIVVVGARNRRRLVPRLPATADALRRAVIAELVLGVVVLGATGFLASFAPPKLAARTSPVLTATGADYAITLRVRLDVTPGRPGPNAFAADVLDYDSRRPARADAVRLTFALAGRPEVRPPALDLRRSGRRWTGRAAAMSVAGTWRVSAIVRRGADAVQVPLRLRLRAPVPRVEVRRAPGQPTIYIVPLTSGGTLQAFLDPDRPGPGELHLTFFSVAGDEEPAEVTRLEASSGGRRIALEFRRLTPGHYVAPVQLRAGRLTFRIAATVGGLPVEAQFTHQIQEAG